MDHMRVNDHYRVWHGLSHMDDALMAPVNHNHFDGYVAGALDAHEVQARRARPGPGPGRVVRRGRPRLPDRVADRHGARPGARLGALPPDLDNTTIDQDSRIVEIHRPDGKPDVLQQIEHGVLTVVGGYNSLGRLYRGIQDASLHQYTILGDAAT
jgi:endoglucanase